jgi:hypothetical protein
VTLGALSTIALAAVMLTLYVRGGPPVQSAASFPSWATSSCAVIRTDRWSPLPGVEYTGRLELDLPAAPAATMVLIASDPLPLDPDAQSVTGQPVAIKRERLKVGAGLSIPPDLWLDSGNPWDIPAEAVRLTLDASPVGPRRLTLGLGRRAPHVLARLFGYPESARGSVCAARLGVVEAFADASALVIAPGEEDWFGAGWYGVDTRDGGAVRWMSARGAILVPAARDGTVRVRLHAAPAAAIDPADPPMLSLVVNGVFDAQPAAMREAMSAYDWDIPDRAWLAHTNELLFSVSRTTWTAAPGSRRSRELGLALGELELTLRGEVQSSKFQVQRSK